MRIEATPGALKRLDKIVKAGHRGDTRAEVLQNIIVGGLQKAAIVALSGNRGVRLAPKRAIRKDRSRNL